jgi:hypothetical protein
MHEALEQWQVACPQKCAEPLLLTLMIVSIERCLCFKLYGNMGALQAARQHRALDQSAWKNEPRDATAWMLRPYLARALRSATLRARRSAAFAILSSFSF